MFEDWVILHVDDISTTLVILGFLATVVATLANLVSGVGKVVLACVAVGVAVPTAFYSVKSAENLRSEATSLSDQLEIQKGLTEDVASNLDDALESLDEALAIASQNNRDLRETREALTTAQLELLEQSRSLRAPWLIAGYATAPFRGNDPSSILAVENHGGEILTVRQVEWLVVATYTLSRDETFRRHHYPDQENQPAGETLVFECPFAPLTKTFAINGRYGVFDPYVAYPGVPAKQETETIVSSINLSGLVEALSGTISERIVQRALDFLRNPPSHPNNTTYSIDLLDRQSVEILANELSGLAYSCIDVEMSVHARADIVAASSGPQNYCFSWLIHEDRGADQYWDTDRNPAFVSDDNCPSVFAEFSGKTVPLNHLPQLVLDETAIWEVISRFSNDL